MSRAEADEDRFREAALGWLDGPYGFALSLSRDASVAQDLVQETYVRALGARRKADPESNLRVWLFVILHNVWRNQIRRTRPDRPADDVAALLEVPDGSAGPDQELERKRLRARLREALAALPRRLPAGGRAALRGGLQLSGDRRDRGLPHRNRDEPPGAGPRPAAGAAASFAGGGAAGRSPLAAPGGTGGRGRGRRSFLARAGERSRPAADDGHDGRPGAGFAALLGVRDARRPQHLRYTRHELLLDVRADRPEEVSRWFSGRVPFHLALPNYPVGPGERKFYRLEGGRLISFQNESAALVAYRMEERAISLLVTSASLVQPGGGDVVPSGRLRFHVRSVEGLKVIT